jgi:excinuclease ABC subunit C
MNEAPLTGTECIKQALKNFPEAPGVYRMVSAKGKILYVGKAKNLKKRVQNYTLVSRLNERLQRMVNQTASVEIIVTKSESEALLLENNLIKRHRPPFNILLRDDKSFPYILITGDHDYPRIMKYRGSQNKPGQYYGPFASIQSVNETLTILQKAFLLRSCSDNVFEGRHRPCLLYQIRRCSGPCVERINKDDYQALTKDVNNFLSGKSQNIQKRLTNQMHEASEKQDYESAKIYRDRIRALSQIQSDQDIILQGEKLNADILAIGQQSGLVSIQIFFYRQGRNYGNKAFFIELEEGISSEKLLSVFIGQFYDGKIPPPLLILDRDPNNKKVLLEALSQSAGHTVNITIPKRGQKYSLLQNAQKNAEGTLNRKLSEDKEQRKLFDKFTESFELPSPPKIIEVYDNSHISGTNAVGALIVAGPEGFIKNRYRRFNISSTKCGDDYAMMREVLTRRFKRALTEDPDKIYDNWPDVIFIDGGAGHLSIVHETLVELGIEDFPVIAISKGPDRNAGREFFHIKGQAAFQLPEGDSALHYIQRLRDEAHRFAIEGHRKKRAKGIGRSVLDNIPGIGAKRKRCLLLYFGSVKNITGAAASDLEKAEGISKKQAQQIYNHLHKE